MAHWNTHLRKISRRLNRPVLKSARFSRRTAPGEMPGLVVPDPKAPKPRIRMIAYDATGHDEREIADVSQISALLDSKKITWIDVTGLGDTQTLESIGQIFNLHRLELEDIVNTHQRAKVEDYSDHIYIVMREAIFASPLINISDTAATTENPDAPTQSAVLSDSKMRSTIEPEPGQPSQRASHPHTDHPSKVWVFDTDQVSICLGPNWVLTFQEKYGDCFGMLRDRIRHQKGKICSSGSDALAYAIIDAIIDSYFPVLELYGERLEHVEEETTGRPTPQTAQAIHDVKRDLLTMRRAIWPAREAVNTLIREEHKLVAAETRLYLRDCYDHLIQLLDMLETYREIGSGLMDIYLASMSNRMNEIMKVLTIIATIFMPLSFLAGLYGMNFSTDTSHWNMPELHWRFGYFYALGVMAAVALAMIWYFRRKGWFSGNGH